MTDAGEGVPALKDDGAGVAPITGAGVGVVVEVLVTVYPADSEPSHPPDPRNFYTISRFLFRPPRQNIAGNRTRHNGTVKRKVRQWPRGAR